MASEEVINIPQLIVLGIAGFLAYRWLSGSSSAGSSPSVPARPLGSRTAMPRNLATFSGEARADLLAKVEAALEVFPSEDHRRLLWFVYNNPTVTADRLVARLVEGRALEQPPSTFNPRIPASSRLAAPPAVARPAPAATTSSAEVWSKNTLAHQFDLKEAIGRQDNGQDPFDGLPDDLYKPMRVDILESRARWIEKRREEYRKKNGSAASSGGVAAGATASLAA